MSVAVRPRAAALAAVMVHQAGHMRITPTFAAAAALAAAGADIIALDCTDRPHVHGEPWQELVERIHSELGVLVMADIATLEEGIAAAAAGADLIGTTLNGYTSATQHGASFDWELLSALKKKVARPIVAEGHIGTPADAKRAIEEGAWCVVAGTAITRPGAITKVFLDAVRSAAKSRRRRLQSGSISAALRSNPRSLQGMERSLHRCESRPKQVSGATRLQLP